MTSGAHAEHARANDPIALWVVPVADLGGVARHVIDAAGAGIPGWRVVVLCPPGALARALGEVRAPVLTGALGPSAGLRASISTLRHALGTLRPGIVHSHLAYADVLAALCKPARGTALISTEHGIASDDLVYHGTRSRAWLKATVHSLRMHRFDELIAVSHGTRAAMIEKWRIRRRIHVVHNGIDRILATSARTDYYDAAQRGISVAALSRLAPEKRIHDLIDAFALVHASDRRSTLTIAGAGPLEGELRRHARVTGLGRAVQFPGHVDARELLAHVDVLAQLSVWENLSYSLLEALAYGVGVVASPVGGNPELLPAQCLVDPSDTAEVARAIQTQALDPRRRPKLPDHWPTVADMTAQIAEVYAGARQDVPATALRIRANGASR